MFPEPMQIILRTDIGGFNVEIEAGVGRGGRRMIRIEYAETLHGAEEMIRTIESRWRELDRRAQQLDGFCRICGARRGSCCC